MLRFVEKFLPVGGKSPLELLHCLLVEHGKLFFHLLVTEMAHEVVELTTLCLQESGRQTLQHRTTTPLKNIFAWAKQGYRERERESESVRSLQTLLVFS